MKADPSKCISASEAGTTDGTNVEIWECGNGAAYEFLMPESGSGFIRMKADLSKCITASDAGTTDGTNVEIWECGSGTAYEFITKEAADAVTGWSAR